MSEIDEKELKNLVQSPNQLDVWAKVDTIRKTFAPTLTNEEFKIFIGMGASLGANPFNREIWAVKYGNSTAQIFLGRDFYRRIAQEQVDYQGHQVDAIYANDTFAMVDGHPSHTYALKDRGELLGAYCVVYRGNNKPFFNLVYLSEYDTQKSLWKSKPATMIKKVAEAQALRGAYQGLFSGTYDESEVWAEDIPKAYEDMIPFTEDVQKTKDGSKYWLTDGTPEFEAVRDAVMKGDLDPTYLKSRYAGYESTFEYFFKLKEDRLAIDNAEVA